MAQQQVLLAVLAHPDDESFGMGGTLALYAERGAAVHLVCATRGEAGYIDEEFLQGFESAADRRTSELRCAAAILGLAGVYFLDYRDSGMAGSEDNQHPQALINAALERVAGQIVTHIRKLRPQVVVTFDPIGGYKHPDHIHIHRATVRACQLAGDANYHDPEDRLAFQPERLYYHLMPKGAMRWAVRLMRLVGRDPRRFGRNQDIDLLDLVQSGDFPTHALIDYRAVDEKRAEAAACHVSQLAGGPPRRGIRKWLFGQRDHYMQAYPAVQSGQPVKHDLFV